MKQKKEDDIMAEYLLKGGKMLERSCKHCGCPMFEYKGKTFCVVYTEREQEKKVQGETANTGASKKTVVQKEEVVPAETAAGNTTIASELGVIILDLCQRIKEEEDPDRCLALMDAVKIGAEALQILRQL